MDADTLENIYYAVTALVMAWLIFNGWRQGVVRQFMAMFAIASAYAAAYFGARTVAPLFGFLRYPEPVTILIGGVAAALVTYAAIAMTSRAYFKRTKEQTEGSARQLYGVFGAVLGLVFGCVLFLAATDVVRLLGALAKSNVEAVEQQQQIEAMTGHPAPLAKIEISPVISGLAKLSAALENGGSGDFIKKVDPVPAHVFRTLAKLGLMVSRPEAVDRFLTYPGIGQLTNHPKLLALRRDPEVDLLLNSRSYFRLLRHDKVVELAGDQDFAAQIKKMNFDEALDYALKGGAAPR